MGPPNPFHSIHQTLVATPPCWPIMAGDAIDLKKHTMLRRASIEMLVDKERYKRVTIRDLHIRRHCYQSAACVQQLAARRVVRLRNHGLIFC